MNLDILLVEPLASEAIDWLRERHGVEVREDLASDPRALRQAAYRCSAIVLPRDTVVTRQFLDFAPRLKAVARLHGGTDNTDLEACRERSIRVVHAVSANVRSNAEYLLTCLLLMSRRGVASSLRRKSAASGPPRLGRELHGSTVGMLGMSPVAHTLSTMLANLGCRVVGYDPAVHHSAPLWANLRVEPMSISDMLAQADFVSVQMLYATRYRGLINERMLETCKPGQIWVGVSRSSLFDAGALASALQDGRIDACMLDGPEDGFAGEGSPLEGVRNLFTTPRLGGHTHEARMRASWYIAHRLHEALTSPADSTQSASALMDL